MNISCIYHNVELENLFVFHLLNGLYRMMVGALGGLEKRKKLNSSGENNFFLFVGFLLSFSRYYVSLYGISIWDFVFMREK